MSKEYALIPKYMERFECIGAKCEDTCCALWNVSIDKKSYNTYTKIPDRTWRQRFKASVTKVNNNATDSHYASMKLDQQTGDCTMMSGGLCAIQATFGEDYLSPTCATYPRKINEIDGVQEISATPSCPEVTRLMLFDPDGIEFVQSVPIRKKNMQMNRKISTEKGEFSTYLWDVRIAAIEILQNREFEVSHRVLILGWLCDQIHQVTKNGDFSTVKDEIEKFKYQLENDKDLRNYKIFPVNQQFQLTFLNKLIMDRAEQGIWNVRYRECLNDYIDGINSSDGDTQSIIANYTMGYAEYYLPYMNQHEYVLENYLVNHVYHSVFPVAGKRGIFDQYLLLAVNFALIKMHLIGMAKHHKGLSDELIVKFMQSFSKNYEHNSGYLQSVCNQIKEEKYDTMGHLSLLIKNEIVK